MTKAKTTKRALLMSVLSMMLCMAMLVGSTFAWFTDSVTSGMNKIVAGNLDVELEYATFSEDEDGETVTTWKSVEGAEDIFGDVALWEPGTTGVAYFRLSNLGTLALKYKLAMNFTDTVIGKNADGADIKLSEILEFGIVEDQEETFASREDAIAAVTNAQKVSDGYSPEEMSMGVTDEKTYFALVVYMPTTVGNEANYRGTAIPQIDLGVTLLATQDTVEKDSFDTDYDADAPVDFVQVATNQELQDALKNAPADKPITILLSDDINVDTIFLDDGSFVVGDITIQGNGHTMTVNTERARAMRIETTVSDRKVSIQNTNIVLTEATVAESKDQRGLSLFQMTGGTVNLTNCKIELAADNYSYAINLVGCKDITMNISNCELTSANVINCRHSQGCTINVDRCVLTSNYYENPSYHGYCISNNDPDSTGTTITVSNTVFNGDNAEDGNYIDAGNNTVNTSIKNYID